MPNFTFSEGTTPRPRDTRWRVRAKQLIAALAAKGASSPQASAADTRWMQRRKLNQVLTGTT